MFIRVTKEFSFEMAHALMDHDGPCKNIHGHSYQLSITLKGKSLNENGNPKNGMVLDFSELKELVNKTIISRFDHSLVLNKKTPPEIYAGLTEQKLILLDFQPTCENLAAHFAGILQKIIPDNIQLHHLKLRETATAFAEWYSEDNS